MDINELSRLERELNQVNKAIEAARAALSWIGAMDSVDSSSALGAQLTVIEKLLDIKSGLSKQLDACEENV